MGQVDLDNIGYVEVWNNILTPKWLRFRHLLRGNGKSDIASELFAMAPGDKVLDVGCGFGDTSLAIGRTVTPEGEVLGIDWTEAFLDVANRERDEAGLFHVRYQLGDAQVFEFPGDYFDVAYSRLGILFFQSTVHALRNMNRALKPGGRACLIVWRTLKDNPCWGAAKEIALRYLPPPGEDGMTCGPGPFSLASEDTVRYMLKAGGFVEPVIQRVDADLCIGRSVEEAVEYQLLCGPSGEIVREAGDEGQRRMPELRAELEALMRGHAREDGVFMPSSTWAIVATKPR